MPLGNFSYRKKDDLCAHYGEVCPVNREQKDAAFDVCAWCIEQRSKQGDHRKPVMKAEAPHG